MTAEIALQHRCSILYILSRIDPSSNLEYSFRTIARCPLGSGQNGERGFLSNDE
jgi:hypothetical protein